MTLLFFTSSFPYGKGETFIENEISFLAGSFEQVIIFPMSCIGERRPCPKNVRIVDLNKKREKQKGFKFLRFYRDFIREYLILTKLFFLGKIPYIQFRYLLSLFKNYIEKAEYLSTWISENNIANPFYYSYWFESWATILSILKKNGIITSFHARTHGFDLYEERSKYGFIPFRNLQLKEATTVSAVSKAGYDYLNQEHPKFKNKFRLNKLGVINNNSVGPFKQNTIFTIVSCSNVVPLKRVNLIVEILSFLLFPVHWIHFGDGILLSEVEKSAEKLPKNIIVEFKGRVSNSQILEYYRRYQVNLFITTTASEGGCPVSIQEAISFGIPVIGTAVGGVPEVVNENTGMLIEMNFESEKVAKLIGEFAVSELNSTDFRMNVRKYWEQNFQAKTNFNCYIDEVLLNYKKY